MPELADIRLKVCGLRDNISEVVALRPDFVGFIFYPGSPRYVGDLETNKIKDIPESIKTVGVFVNQPIDQVKKIAHRYNLDLIQLHGEEPVDYCVELKAEDLNLIKVFSGNKLPEHKVLEEYSSFIDYYLFDTRGEKHGGTGKIFNWGKLADLRLKKPVFLSGGIDLENIKKLRELETAIYAVDVNSRFEISPGLKDIQSLERLKSIMTD